MEAQTKITRDDLGRLLAAKDAAQKAMSAAYAAISAAKDSPAEARLSLDLDRHRALQTYVQADNAYDAALKAYVQVAA